LIQISPAGLLIDLRAAIDVSATVNRQIMCSFADRSRAAAGML
jgi:hypothetical protein